LGAAARKTREAADLMAACGLTPLGYFQGLLEGTMAFDEVKFEAAKAAAPFVHARLANIESRTEVLHRFVARVPNKEVSPETWQQQNAPKIPTIQ
jgi:hypothetical protein